MMQLKALQPKSSSDDWFASDRLAGCLAILWNIISRLIQVGNVNSQPLVEYSIKWVMSFILQSYLNNLSNNNIKLSHQKKSKLSSFLFLAFGSENSQKLAHTVGRAIAIVAAAAVNPS